MQSTAAWRLSVAAFALAAMLLAGVGWIAFRRLGHLHDASEWVQHTLRVRAEADGVLSLLKDAETGQRGFVITRTPAYLEPYEAALAALPAQIDRLRRLVSDNPAQQARLATLDALAGQKIAELRLSVLARERGGFEAAAALIDTGRGKRLMDDARAVVAAIDAHEDRLLAAREASEDAEERLATVTTLGGLGGAAGALMAATLLMGLAVRQRERERTARLTAEAITAAVRQSEERLRVTIGSIGDAVIATDNRGRITQLNAVAEALTGWTQADAAGRALEDVLVIVEERSRRPADNPVAKVLREGVVAGLANHTLLLSRDGREIPIDDSAAPILSDDGRTTGVVMVFRDITERRRAEREHAALLDRERGARAEADRARREAETAADQLRVALEAARMGTWEHAVTSGQATWSPNLEAIHGLPPGGFPGTFDAFLDGIHAADRQRVVDAIRVSIEQGTDYHVEYRIIRPDGRLRWLEARGQVLRDDQGRPERMAGVCLDVTERKRAEETFRLAVEAAPAAMIMVDRRGTITMVNALTERLLGYARHEIIGRSVDQLVPPRFRGGHSGWRGSFFVDARQRPMGAGRDLYALRKDGSEVPVEIGLSPIETAEGVFVLAAVTDITERKRVEDRSAQLLVREQAARAELERASRLKDDFLAMLSHELRTPLNAVLGYAHLLASSDLPPEQAAHALAAIRRNAQAQGRLVESLLDLSRIVEGKFELNLEPVDLAQIADAALDAVRLDADAKGIRLDVDVPEDAVPITGDASRLQQVLWNLLANAVKFTPPGGRVALRVTRDDSYAQVQVSDTGEGISAEFLPHVFDRFRQAPGAAARAGLGLGLSLVRDIVEAHGGSVAADSAGAGAGSTFTVTLPRSARGGRSGQEASPPQQANGPELTGAGRVEKV